MPCSFHKGEVFCPLTIASPEPHGNYSAAPAEEFRELFLFFLTNLPHNYIIANVERGSAALPESLLLFNLRRAG